MPTLAEIAAKYGGTPDASLAAKHGGVLDSLAAKELPGGFAPMTPEQTEAGLAMNRPEAMTRRWLRTGPYVGGALGALAIKNPRGAGLGAEAVAGLMQMLGAGVGGTAGRAAEHQAGGTWPETDAERWRSLGGAGVQQAMLQAPASAVGIAGEGLVGLRGVMRRRAERQAAEEVATKMNARRSTVQAQLGQRLPAAKANRQAAAAETRKAIQAATENVTLGELVDKLVARREGRVSITGKTMSDKARERLTKEAQRRVSQVVRNYSGGVLRPPGPPAVRQRVSGLVDEFGRPSQPSAPAAVDPSAVRYDMPLSQVSKQAFDDLVRAANLGREGGVKPKPGLDIDVADAFRSLIEEKVPGIHEMNRVTSRAIRTEQRLMRKKRNFPTEDEFQIDLAANQEVARQMTRNKRSANPLTMFKGIPVRGGVAMPGFTVRPGGLSEFGGKVGEVMASAPMEQAMMWSPRAFALFMEWKRQMDEDAARLGAPADVTNPQPRAAKEE